MDPAPFWIRRSTSLAVALGGAVILLPALWFGPLLPLLDTVCFAGLNSYPARLSYGPFHYYVFQFTYILPLVLSRLCTDLGIGPPRQVEIFYLIQAAAFYCMISLSLHRLVPNRAIRGLAIAGGALAFWDGLFLWGGPLAYSLAAAIMAVAVLLTVLEACDNSRHYSGWVAALSILAAVSHPFAVPMAMVLAAARFLLLPGRRLKSAGLLCLLLVFALVIKHDSPEGTDLSRLFSLQPSGMPAAFCSLFTWDGNTCEGLLGVRSPALSLLFFLMAAVRVAGFAASPFALVLSRRSPGVRMLAALDVVVAALYFCSRENPAISMWPERILTFNSSITYASGIVAPLFLLGHLGILERLAGVAGARRFARLWPAAAILIAVIWVCAETPVLRTSRLLQANWESAKRSFLALGYRDGTVFYTGFDALHPLYLRSVPFLLSSDPEVTGRGLVFVTEWHTQPRHPTRVAQRELENAGYETARPEYYVDFAMKEGRMEAIPLPRYVVNVPLRIRFGAGIPKVEPGLPLVTTGEAGNANFVYALRSGPDSVVLGVDRWGLPLEKSAPIHVRAGQEYSLRVQLGMNTARLELDGTPVLLFHGIMRDFNNVEVGCNRIGGGTSLPDFPGGVQGRHIVALTH